MNAVDGADLRRLTELLIRVALTHRTASPEVAPT